MTPDQLEDVNGIFQGPDLNLATPHASWFLPTCMARDMQAFGTGHVHSIEDFLNWL